MAVFISFIVGDKVRVRNHDATAKDREGYIQFTPAEIVKRAKAEIGKVYKYNFFLENCEEWATTVRYGVPFSYTVSDD